MIPKRMAFYWEGGAMSWLRLQTIQTFVRFHPDWELVAIDHEGTESFSDCAVDTRADIARWLWLSVHGGFFMDLDIVWMDRLPDSLRLGSLALTADGGTPSKDGRSYAMGLVGAVVRHHVIGQWHALATELASPEDHQSAGTKMMASSPPSPELVTPIPSEKLHPFGFSQEGLGKVWSDLERLPKQALWGVHWSGGHQSSRLMEQNLSASNYKNVKAPIAEALRRAYGDHEPWVG